MYLCLGPKMRASANSACIVTAPHCQATMPRGTRRGTERHEVDWRQVMQEPRESKLHKKTQQSRRVCGPIRKRTPAEGAGRTHRQEAKSLSGLIATAVFRCARCGRPKKNRGGFVCPYTKNTKKARSLKKSQTPSQPHAWLTKSPPLRSVSCFLLKTMSGMPGWYGCVKKKKKKGKQAVERYGGRGVG